jgi:hypothetical protein
MWWVGEDYGKMISLCFMTAEKALMLNEILVFIL